MEITLDKSGSSSASIKVKLVESDYQDRVNSKIKDYGKKANIKGFRPGKVPASVVKRMLGSGFIADEVFGVVSDSLNNYIKENKLAIIGDPLPSDNQKELQIDWDTQKEFEFDYDIGLVPDFKYDISDKFKVQKYKVEADQKAIDETVEQLQKQHGESTTPDSVQAGDSVTAEITEQGEGNFIKKLYFEIDKVNSKELKRIIGCKKGDTFIFDLKKANKKDSEIFAIPDEELKKLSSDFELDIQEVTRTTPAEINQDFLNKLFGPDAVKSEEEMNSKIGEIIGQNQDREAENKLFWDIQEALVEKTKVDIPREFFKKWLIMTNKGNLTKEKIDADFPKYEKELKWTLIRNKIAEDNDFKVDEGQVIAKATEMLAAQYFGGMGVPPEMEAQMRELVDNHLRQDNGNNYMRTYEQILSEKVFELIKSSATIKDKKVKSEEFKKILNK